MPFLWRPVRAAGRDPVSASGQPGMPGVWQQSNRRPLVRLRDQAVRRGIGQGLVRHQHGARLTDPLRPPVRGPDGAPDVRGRMSAQMLALIAAIAFVVVWFVLMKFVLPRFGVPT